MDRTPQTAAPGPLAPFMAGPTAIDPVLAGRLLSAALADGGEFAELFFEYRQGLSVALEDGQVRGVGASVDAGVGIRVVIGGAVGFAYAESFEPAVMLAAARTAAMVARARGAARQRTGGRAGPRARAPASAAPPPSTLPMAACLEVLRRVDRAARLADPAIVHVEASLALLHREILIVSSSAGPVHDVAPLLRLSVAVVAERGARRESGSTGGGGRVGLEHFASRTPESFGEEAARIALVNLDARDAPAGTLPVVLAPGDAGIWLHEAVGHGLEADFIRKRSSSYSDRLGQQVASPRVTLCDDPAIVGGRGSMTVDDEGAPAQAHLLIDRGVLRGHLHDRSSARAAGLTAAGSGRRQSFRDLPLPRMSNTFLAAGDDDPADILRSVRLGVYAARFRGGQVNIAAGDFVFELTEGYLIEDGKLTAPLRGAHLIGHGPTALAAVSMVGHDLHMSEGTWTCTKEGQHVPVGVGMPTVKIDALTIGGTALAGARR